MPSTWHRMCSALGIMAMIGRALQRCRERTYRRVDVRHEQPRPVTPPGSCATSSVVDGRNTGSNANFLQQVM